MSYVAQELYTVPGGVPASPFTHGRSEYWNRPVIARAIEKEQRRLGLRLRQIRERAGLTQQEAAEKAGLHPVGVTRLENGKQNATVSTLVCLSLAYRVSIAELFSDAVHR
jgi:DNA-binding XRE family transcriptional regulator